MSFQNEVNLYQSPGVEGGFAGANPRASVVSGVGAFLAGEGGVNTGRFAWAVNGVVTNTGTGAPTGFVGRDTLPAGITNFLGAASINIPEGYPVTLYSAGDFWVRPGNGAAPDAAVFANPADGTILTGTAGSPPAATSFTASIAATGVMTVTAVGSGTIVPGIEINGTGVPAGTVIESQLSGTTGGVGTYQTTADAVVASTTITAGAYVATKWSTAADATGVAGNLVKMTTWN